MENDTLVCLTFIPGRSVSIGICQIFYAYSLYSAGAWSKIDLKLNPTSATNKLSKYGQVIFIDFI